MEVTVQRGTTPLPSAIDALASNPSQRSYAAIPREDQDLSKGFCEIDYRLFARAIDRASLWLDETLGKVEDGDNVFPTFSYEGPKDMRFPILTVAAVKTGRTMLVLSSLASAQGRAHLVEITKCRHMLYGQGFQDIVHATVAKSANAVAIEAAPLSVWLGLDDPLPEGGYASSYPYTKSWEQVWSDPVVTFHTSGTTGLPKPITWTNAMMTYNDASADLPRGDANVTADIGRTRYFTTTGNGPGVSSSLQHAIWRGATVVFGPAHRWPDATLATDVILAANVGSMMTNPNVIEAMVASDDGIKALRSLNLLMWTGAPLDERVGARLAAHESVRLAPVYGTTECAGLQMHVCKDAEDWDAYEFQEGQGIVFEEHDDNMNPEQQDVDGSKKRLYELVVRLYGKNELNQPISEAGYVQPVFCARPHPKDEWRSRDLFTSHKDRSKSTQLWRYRGRKDDFLLLSNGFGLLPTLYEPLIAAHPAVRAALIGGQGRPAPFLLLQLEVEDASTELRDDIWTKVETDINYPSLGEWVSLRRENLLIADPGKPFIFAEKGTVSRSATLSLYADEIELLYQ